MRGFYQNIYALIEAIEDCLEKRRIMPCLVLLYTGLDVVASLERAHDEGTRVAFTRWVDSYLLNRHSLGCTALELYAARCGILHTFTAESDLSRADKTREIVYAWGNQKKEDLQEAIRLTNRDWVALHVRDLIDAFREALLLYVEEIEKDPGRQQLVERRAGVWFTNMSPELLHKFLALKRSETAT